MQNNYKEFYYELHKRGFVPKVRFPAYFWNNYMTYGTRGTKGEWKIAEGDFIYCLNAEGTNRFNLQVQGGYVNQKDGNRTSVSELEANAHLISAAPDMYEALNFTIRQIKELHKLKGDFGLTNAILGLAKQTLAKAEGKETK